MINLINFCRKGQKGQKGQQRKKGQTVQKGQKVKKGQKGQQRPLKVAEESLQ